MNLRTCRALIGLLAGCAPLAAASPPFAWQWPLQPKREGEPAYQVVLDEEVYAAVLDPDLADLVVVDAAGVTMPSRLLRPPAEVPPSTWREPVAWFVLPEGETPAAFRARQGSFESPGVRLRWEATEGGAAPAPGLLLDLDGGYRTVRAVWLQPAGEDKVWRARFEVLSSADLARWSRAAEPADLFRLRQQGRELALLRIGLQRAPDRYLWLRPTQDSARGAVGGVEVERAEAPVVEAGPLRWLELDPQPGEGGWLYRTPGPMQVEAWDLEAGPGNWVLDADLASRSGPGDDWRPRAREARFRWQTGDEHLASAPGPLAPTRDREWRLRLAPQPAAPPRLRLAWRPDRLQFLAQAEGPYRLLAGSARARRQEAPVEGVIRALQQHRGLDWEPPPASLGARAELDGPAALQPPAEPVDWARWVLWTVLLAAALSVAGIALRLLRQAEDGPGAGGGGAAN